MPEQLDNMDEKSWISAQERTFLRWVNVKLTRGGYDKLAKLADLSTGVPLFNLLNVLTKTELQPIHKRPTIKFQRVENVDKFLDYVKNRENVHIYNIGAEDIADGNVKLTLGLVWSLILRYSMDDQEGDASGMKRDILLRWVQLATEEYREVKLTNFGASWSNGLGLAALLDHFKPGTIDYERAKRRPGRELVDLVLQKAEEVGVPRLVDTDDLACAKPDERSVMAYIGEWYDTFHMKEVLEMKKKSKDKRRQSLDDLKDDASESLLVSKRQVRIRIETFIAVVGSIADMKNKFLHDMEDLIVSMANWMVQLSFSRDEFQDVEDVIRFRKGLHTYVTTGKIELFKQLSMARSQKVKLNMCLRDYNFATFEEPQGKSLERAQVLLEQLRTFEREATRFVSEYFEARAKELTQTFHESAKSIQVGLGLIESELAEEQPSTKEQLNALTEIMDDLGSFEQMTAQLDGIYNEIVSLYLQFGRTYDRTEANLVVSRFKVKIKFLRRLVTDRVEFMDRQFKNKQKVFQIMNASMQDKVTAEERVKSSFQRITREMATDENADLADSLGNLELERYVFDKFDRAGKGYLNKAEFREAFGYLYPGISADQLDQLFEILYDSSHDILRGIRLEDFARVLKSTSSDGQLENKPEKETKTKAAVDKPVISDEQLADMKGQYYLDTFKEACDNRDFVTSDDLAHIRVDKRLLNRIGAIMRESEEGTYDYKQFFAEPGASLLYEDVTTAAEEDEEDEDEDLMVPEARASDGSSPSKSIRSGISRGSLSSRVKGLDSILQDIGSLHVR